MVGPGRSERVEGEAELKRALAQLAAAEVDAAGAAARDRAVAFCEAHPDALRRTCAEGHLTASALVVDRAAGRFVVLHHRKLGRWLQPGGHPDGDDDLAAVALREAVEETGLDGLRVVEPAVDVDVHEVAPPGEPPHLHLDVRFVVEAPDGASGAGPPPGNHESVEIRWVTVADLGALGADESVRRLARRGLAPP